MPIYPRTTVWVDWLESEWRTKFVGVYIVPHPQDVVFINFVSIPCHYPVTSVNGVHTELNEVVSTALVALSNDFAERRILLLYEIVLPLVRFPLVPVVQPLGGLLTENAQLLVLPVATHLDPLFVNVAYTMLETATPTDDEVQVIPSDEVSTADAVQAAKIPFA